MKHIHSLLILATCSTAAFAMGHAAWDIDGDGVLSPDEFRAGFGALATHVQFDADGNGLLNEAEWMPVLGQIGDFANMDLNTDGGIDSDEYVAILFNRYDLDGSAALDGTEQALIESDLSAGGLLAN